MYTILFSRTLAPLYIHNAKNTMGFRLILAVIVFPLLPYPYIGNFSIFSDIHTVEPFFNTLGCLFSSVCFPFDSMNSHPFHMHKHKCATNTITTHARWLLFKNISRISLRWMRCRLECVVRHRSIQSRCEFELFFKKNFGYELKWIDDVSV